jgi:hypothetical protein
MYLATCYICSTQFVPHKGRANVGRFCSLTCVGTHQKSVAKDRYLASPKNCRNCNDIIPYEKRDNKFCCQSCAASYNNRGVRRHGKAPGYCDHCRQPKASAEHRYCSVSCSAQANTKYHSDADKLEAARVVNRTSQAKYRAKGYRKIDPTADKVKIKEIYAHCPEGYEVDHIIPLSLGGKHHEDNLQYLTIRENRSKSNRWIG